MSQSADILVVGGGIIGLTSAIRLRQAGAAVAVYDRGDFGREASWAGAGIIPPGNPERAATPIDKLRAIGSRDLPAFSEQLRERTGIDNGYRRNGGIEFLTAEDEYAVGLWEAEGIAFEKWNDRRVPDATAYYLPGMAQVRNPWHLKALIAFAKQIGVELHPQVGIESWLIEKGRVTGVSLANGTTAPAKQFLVTAGPWSERLLGNLNCRPGVHPIRGQILLLKTEAETLRHTLIAGKRYLVPRGDGRVLVGSTEEPEAGFAKQTTPIGLDDLRAFAIEMVPELADAEIEQGWAGLRPGSPDGMPFIGPVPDYRNVFAAVGHSRAGVQLSLGTAQLVTEFLLNRPTCVPKSAFALDRRPDARAKPTFRS